MKLLKKTIILITLFIVLCSILLDEASLTTAAANRSRSDFDQSTGGNQTGSGKDPSQTQASGEGITLLSSDHSEVSFIVNVPWQALEIEASIVNAKNYVQVSLPDWINRLDTGEPALPHRIAQIGVPFEAIISVEVVTGNAHAFQLAAPVMPVPSQKYDWNTTVEDFKIPGIPETQLVYEEDLSIYTGSALYPGTLAEVTSDGVLRQQRIAGVSVYPIQYSPVTLELIVYETLQVTVSFTGMTSDFIQANLPDSLAYENLFKSELLNYESAKEWRRSENQSSINADRSSAATQIPWAPPDPGWRVKVREDGIYKLTYDELIAQGWPASSDADSIQLFHFGEEAAIHVEDNGNGLFDESSDYILFYGTSIKDKYAVDNVYWLTYGNISQGKRITMREGLPGTGTTPVNYLEKLLIDIESNAYYISSAAGDHNLDRWFMDYLYPPVKPQNSYNFLLPAPYPSEATLTISLWGHFSSPSINPDHHVQVYLNTELIGEVTWDGRAWNYLEMTIPPGDLLSGDNTIEIKALLQAGQSVDVIYIDLIELAYQNTFLAENNGLAFTYAQPGQWDYQVSGFTADQISVYDVTDPLSLVRIDNVGTYPADTTFTAQFHDDITQKTDYWVGANTAFRSVGGVEADVASILGSVANGADHIIISHHAFLTQANLLREYRTSQGLRSVVVDVQDIYDEFSYGIEGAAPIHDFLSYAYTNWEAPSPSYVVLLGDGHYDPKYYSKDTTKTNFIPPFLAVVDPSMGETAADNRYVTLTGDDLMPDMMLGRLAVNTAAEATAAITKIIAHEQTAETENWITQVLAVADNLDYAGNFPLYSNNLLDCCLPTAYTAEKVHYGVTHTNIDNARSAIINGINAGKLIVNYYGHGFTSGWAAESLFTASSVNALTNADKQPVVLAMTCMEGYYIYPAAGLNSLAEVITRADGKGALASWSATGASISSGHVILNRGFFNAVFANGVNSIGEATQAGKLNLWAMGATPDLLDTFLLFGDPATVMARPITAFDDAYQAMRNTPLAVSAAEGVLINDPGDSLSAVLVSDPPNGSVILSEDGSFTYTPNPGFFGEDSFTYLASNGTFNSNSAKVTLTVIVGDNYAPVAQDDSYTMSTGKTLVVDPPGVLANDTDADGDPLSAIWVSDPENGVLTLNDDGSFEYLSNSGFIGSASFSYKAFDKLAYSNIATVTITINPNQAPVLSPIGDKTIVKLRNLAFKVEATDPDTPLDTLTFSLIGAPIDAMIDPETGDFSWIPTETNMPDGYTFTVRVCDDGFPSLCDEEEINVMVIDPFLYYLPLILEN